MAMRIPDQADGSGDRKTTSLRVPDEAEAAGADDEEASAEAEDAGDAADDAPAGDHATSVLRLPETGDRKTTSLRLPDEDAEEPEDADPEDAEPEDAEPEDADDSDDSDDSDATSVLRLPPVPDKAPEAEDADAEPEATDADADATSLLRVPPVPDKAAEPEDADAEPEATDADADATSVLRLPPVPDKTPEPEDADDSDSTSVLRLPPVPEKAPEAEGAEATSALPLPPKPTVAPPPADAERDPLDLLAELTNRPAPPPTPLRTLARRVKIWTPLIVLLGIAFVIAQSLRPLPEPTLEMTAVASHTFDGESPTAPWPASGQAVLDVEGLGTFGSSGEQEPVPIASVAKVMTAYVVLRNHPMAEDGDGESIPVDQQAEDDAALSNDGESTVEVEAGTSLTQREALQAILIASANNVARLLARWDAGSEEEFVAEMNATAAELGMENTTYTDPSGLDETTVSTAEDQVILAKAAMDDPVFRAIVAMPSYEDSQGVTHGNWNHLVPVNGVLGIKTGTTTAAGGNLLFAAEQEVGGTRQLIVGAVLAQPPHPSDNSILTGALTAGDSLIRFAQEELRAETVLSAGDVVGYVDDGLGGQTPIAVTEDVQAVGWAGLEVELELSAGDDGIPGSADAGTEVGVLTVGGGPDRVTVPVALAADLGEPGFADRLTRVA
ncbi:D-alanyl-D-alanine carboxypeptidase [Streptomyces sp. URMC 129]|uniref:D-alanyl-D-alanine carboxypeptidase family protein n=1 Tax=Streptomyces sp. URMC 129 TaxID=3423407 RepID=UPI003F1DD48C